MSKTEIDVFYSASVLKHKSYLPSYLAILDKNERSIAERFKFADLTERYIINHGILRQLLADRLDISPTCLRIEKAEFGKPFLPDYPEISFNMSHSGDILTIAISSQCQLGIDVECYKARNTWEGLVKKCFAAKEMEYWYRLNETERGHAFYQFWVKKEAFVKAVGKGITLGLNQCIVNPEDLESFTHVPKQAGLASKWQIHDLELAENEFGAVVCDRKNSLLRFVSL